jgi:hypothetical protein
MPDTGRGAGIRQGCRLAAPPILYQSRHPLALGRALAGGPRGQRLGVDAAAHGLLSALDGHEEASGQ